VQNKTIKENEKNFAGTARKKDKLKNICYNTNKRVHLHKLLPKKGKMDK